MRSTESTDSPTRRRTRRGAPALLLSLSLVIATPAAAAPQVPAADPGVITTWNAVAAATIPANPAAFLNYAFVHLAMYNAVGQEYLVNFKHDGRLVESRLVRSRQELAAALTRFDRVRLFDVAGLPRRSRLLVKGRAEMGTRTLLSFIPILLNTEWADSRKFRVP